MGCEHRGSGGRRPLVSLRPPRRVHRSRLQGNQLLRLSAAAGPRRRHDADADAGVEPVGVHVRVSAGAGGHRSPRPDLHAHRRDAVCRPPDIGTAFALAHAGVLKPGRRAHDLRPRRRSDAPRSRLEGRPARVRVDDAAEADLRQDDRPTPRRWRPRSASSRLRSAAARAAQEVNCGSNFFVVPLPTRKAVDAAVLDRAKVDAVFAAAGLQRRGIYDLHHGTGQDDATAYSRLLARFG